MNDALPYLSFCVTWPLLGAVAVIVPWRRVSAKHIALFFALAELAATLWVALVEYRPGNGGFQLLETHAWIPSLNIHFQFGIDGISAWFLPATALVSVMVQLSSWNGIRRMLRLHLALLLILEGVTVGVFTALDMVQFFLFWELTLPPIFFLGGLWGVKERTRQAAMKYTLFMLFGGIPLLFAIILLSIHSHSLSGVWEFGLPGLLQTALDPETQNWVFFLFLLGFAVKAPLIPFHTWLPITAMEAPPQLTALIIGLKLGLYGFLRFLIPLAPAESLNHQWLLGAWGTATLIYGALLAMAQTNLRGLIGCSSLSHAGFVLVGIAAFNQYGVQGAVLQVLNFSLVASALILLAGMIQQRLGSTESVHLGGLAKTVPRLSTLFFLFAFADIGLPLTGNFVSELLMLIGAFKAYPVLAIVMLLGAVLSAAYVFSFVRHAILGPVRNDEVHRMPDLTPRELTTLLIPAVLVLLLGLFPQTVLDSQKASINVWLRRLVEPAAKVEAIPNPRRDIHSVQKV